MTIRPILFFITAAIALSSAKTFAQTETDAPMTFLVTSESHS